ncbi:MAG: helix-turn-helix domain-containing protein [Planctomycetota bacterium]
MASATASRRLRERLARERLILDTARRMLAELGYLGLNMDRIAEAIEYSKGTVYQHFSSKEDLIAALCADTAAARAEMFRKAASYDGTTRERLMAIGIADAIFIRRHPDHFAVESILDLSSVIDKITDERRDRWVAIKTAKMDVLTRIVQDAVDAGDLVLPEGVPLCAPLYGMWAQAVGHSRISSMAPMPHFAGVDMNAVLWTNYNRMLDGYGWKPLTSDWDYQASAERISTTVFGEPSPAGSLT